MVIADDQTNQSQASKELDMMKSDPYSFIQRHLVNPERMLVLVLRALQVESVYIEGVSHLKVNMTNLNLNLNLMCLLEFECWD